MAKILTVVGEGVWETDNAGVVTFTPEEGFYKSPTPIKYSVKTLDGTQSNLSTIAAQYIAQAPQVGSIAYIGATEDDGSSSAESLITGTKYYFSTSGDDANDGLSPANPKQTIYRMQLLFNSMNAGDGILLKRGDVWDADNFDYATLGYAVKGTAQNPKILTCYGLGNRPKIERTKTQTPTWTLEASGLYSTDITEIPALKIHHVFIDGRFARDTSSLTLLEQQPTTYDWFHDTVNNKMYISTDPQGKTIKWSDAGQVLRFATGVEYITIDNIDLGGCRETALSIPDGGTNVFVQNCAIGKYSKSGLSIQTVNSKVDNCIVDSGKINLPNDDANYRASYGYEGIIARSSSTNISDKGIEIVNCTVANWEHANVILDGMNVDGAWQRNPKMYNCYIDGRNLFYGGKLSVQYQTDGAEVYNNIFNMGDNNQLSGDNGHYHHNIIFKKRTSHLTTAPYNHGDGFGTNVQPTGFSNNIIENNMIFDCDGAAVSLSCKFTYPLNNNIIRNNIMYNTGKLPVVYSGSAENVAIWVNLDDNVNGTLVENNIVYNTVGKEKVIYVGGEEHTTVPEKHFTITEAQAETLAKGTVFRNNSFVDPKLTGYEAMDFKPTVISPIYGAGAATTTPKDIVGQNIDTPVNIGIYGRNEMENV